MSGPAGYGEQSTWPPVPLLPGNTLHVVPDAAKGRRQVCKYVHGIPIMSNLGASQAALHKVQPPYAQHEGASTLNGLIPTSSRTEAAGSSAALAAPPGWLTHDRKVLRFYGYFQESVPNSPLEAWRIRKCTLYFYLEDGSLEVREKCEENSGLPQGTYLRRHRVTSDGQTLDWRQLTVGDSVALYGRPFHIVACDPATRRYLAEAGVAVAADGPYPQGPYDIAQLEKARDQQRPRQPGLLSSTGPNAVAKAASAAQRAQYHNMVLRFYAAWSPDAGSANSSSSSSSRVAGGADAVAGLQGDVQPYVLHYYLEDDTIEVAEVHNKNDGKDPFPLLLQRCRLPKTLPPVGGRPPSQATRDAAAAGADAYHWRELCIGSRVHVYGRSMLIHDMDDATRTWFVNKGGLSPEQLAPIHVDFERKVQRPPEVVPPRWLPIGSEEDTAENAGRLIGRQPRRDIAKITEFKGKVLRFTAKLSTALGHKLLSHHEGGRRFVVSYFMEDDTLSVFEPPIRNSGITGGRTADRSHVQRPHAGPTDYYRPAHMHVGAVLVVNSRAYELLEADEFTLSFMGMHGGMFPVADGERVLHKVRSALFGHRQQLPWLANALLQSGSKPEGVTWQALHGLLHDGMGMDLSAHEAITLIRSVGGGSNQSVGAHPLLQALSLMEG